MSPFRWPRSPFHRRTAAEAAALASVRRPMRIHSRATNGRTAPIRQGKVLRRDRGIPFQGRIARNRPQTGSGLPGTSENRYNLPQVRGSSGKCRMEALMIRSVVHGAISLATISSIACAEDFATATTPLAPGTFTTSTHSDEWKIANALSAGPASITEHAAVMDWPAKSEGWNVRRQGASPGHQWLDMHARRSRKASARPDVRRRDHDEVAHGDPRWEEA